MIILYLDLTYFHPSHSILALPSTIVLSLLAINVVYFLKGCVKLENCQGLNLSDTNFVTKNRALAAIPENFYIVSEFVRDIWTTHSGLVANLKIA